MTEEFETMTVPELKELLREKGLKVGGKKSELIERLSEYSVVEAESPSSVDSEIAESEEEFDEEFEDDFFEDEDEWDDLHTARQKPVLDEETANALSFRAKQKKKQPAFRRQEWYRYKRLSRSSWRKPNGMQSKMRLNRKYRPPMARIGYRKIASARGLHPSGFEEVMVHKSSDLEGLDPETQAVRIGARVGNRKRLDIHDRANSLGLRILNQRKISRKGDL
jgi:large subunit ribosomal protein L32e|tara:strand:- start:124 stop:789 length:666 start_codon:yes stop_codon:yes gene_type:complete